MKEKDTLWPMVGIFVRGAFVILGLMFVLSALVMIFNGGAFSWDLIRKDFKMVFYISLVILLLLFLAIMVMAVFRVQTTPSSGQSMLLKDNTLRYETRDEKGRKKRVTFSIKNIDAYLDRYGKMRIIDGMELAKKDSANRSNLNNLCVLRNGKKITLNELNQDRPEEYVRVCRFLESLSSYDTEKLYWHMNTYIAKEELILNADGISQELKILERSVKDEQILEQIDLVREGLEGIKKRIEADGSSDKLRKLFDHYLPMLKSILEEYSRLESKDEERKELNESKNKLMLTFEYVRQAIDSLSKTDSKEDFEKLEAAVNDVAYLLKTQNAEKADKQA